MKTVYVEEIELNVEEMEVVIAPALNHNETLDVDLSVEEMEEVIAPGLNTCVYRKTQSEHSHAIHLHYQAALGSLSWIAFRRCSALRSV